jgi:hypothetical protein
MQAQAETVKPTFVQSATAINVSNAQPVWCTVLKPGTIPDINVIFIEC